MGECCYLFPTPFYLSSFIGLLARGGGRTLLVTRPMCVPLSLHALRGQRRFYNQRVTDTSQLWLRRVFPLTATLLPNPIKTPLLWHSDTMQSISWNWFWLQKRPFSLDYLPIQLNKFCVPRHPFIIKLLRIYSYTNNRSGNPSLSLSNSFTLDFIIWNDKKFNSGSDDNEREKNKDEERERSNGTHTGGDESREPTHILFPIYLSFLALAAAFFLPAPPALALLPLFQ